MNRRRLAVLPPVIVAGCDRDARFPGHQHSFASVPGVDHSDWCTYLSDAGLRALFDFQPRASDRLESGCRRPPSWE